MRRTRGDVRGHARGHARGDASPLAPCVVEPLEGRALLSVAPVGPEFTVNRFTERNQENPQAASDADGDSVVVWQGFGPEGTTSIFGQRYDATGAPAGGEIHVGRPGFVTRNAPYVAMEPDGDFVVAWTSFPQDGGGYAVFAQRFAADGSARGEEFRVDARDAGSKSAWAVAAGASGNFLVVWGAVADPDAPAGGLYARAFAPDGTPSGGEFLVAPGVGGASAVGTAGGGFLVAWTGASTSAPDEAPANRIRARWYDAAGAPAGDAFDVNETPGWSEAPALSASPDGTLLAAWANEDTGTGAGDSNVYARRLGAAGTPLGPEFRANELVEGRQFDPAVAWAGDTFAVAWTGAAANVTGAPHDVFARSFRADGTPLGPEQRLNEGVVGLQVAPALAGVGGGELLAAWADSFHELADHLGNVDVRARRFRASADVTPPAVVRASVYGREVRPGQRLTAPFYEMRLAFTEPVSTDGASGVTNPANWRLTRNGQDVSDRIGKVDYGYDTVTGLYSATVAFSGDGDFVLGVRDVVADAAGNRLDGDGDGAAGGEYALPFTVRQPGPAGPDFRVNTSEPGARPSPAVASDDAGGFVVAWEGGDGGRPGIFARRYNADGSAAGAEFAVSAGTGALDALPDVAVDDDGDFVVAWEHVTPSGGPEAPAGNADVYARLFARDGSPLGDAFLVNTDVVGQQRRPTVAMDADGDFVVAWEDHSYGTRTYARRFNRAGEPRDAEAFLLNGDYESRAFESRPSAAMNARGDFVVAWLEHEGESGLGSGVVIKRVFADFEDPEFNRPLLVASGRRYTAPSAAIDDDRRWAAAWAERWETNSDEDPNAWTVMVAGLPEGVSGQASNFAGLHGAPSLSADGDGDLAVAWAVRQPGAAGADVYAARLSRAPESRVENVRVNSIAGAAAAGARPAVASDADGDFVVAFAGNDGPSGAAGVFARRFVGGDAPVAVGGPAVAGVEDAQSVVDLSQYFAAGDAGGLTYYVVGDGMDSASPDFDQHGGPLTIRFEEAYAGESGALVVRVVDSAGRWAETAIQVTVAGVNDAPGVNAPDWVAPQAPGPVVLSSQTDGNGFYVGDTEDRLGEAPLRVRLVARGGTVTLSGLEGVTFEEGDGTGDVTMTFTAPSYLANRALDGMRFDPATPVAGSTGVTITVGDLGNAGSGGPREFTKDLPILFAPVVTRVFVAGTRWRREFRQSLFERDLADMTYGFVVRGGPEQRVTLPWATVDQVSIRFSHDVFVNQGHLRVRSGGGGAGYTPVAFAYDPDTRTATWTLDRPIAADRVVLDTTTAGRAIGSPDGTFLVDGEWADGASAFPSGDGVPGGVFRMQLNVLPGDVDRNGVVNAVDAALLRRELGASASWRPARYDPFHDLDGDGRISALDILHQRRRRSSTLPPAGLS